MIGEMTASASSASAGPAQAPTPVEDMDLRDQETQTAIDEGFYQELESLLIPGPSDQVAYGMGAANEGLGRAEDDDDGDEDTARAVAAGVAQTMASVDPDEGPAAAGEEGADVADVEAPASEPAQLWQALGLVTPQGYVYDSTPRSVLRIQRGKPKNSVTVNCYLHIGCKLLLTETRCPSDEVLKQWLYEVPAPKRGSSRDEVRQLAEEHMQLGKGRWGGRGKK